MFVLFVSLNLIENYGDSPKNYDGPYFTLQYPHALHLDSDKFLSEKEYEARIRRIKRDNISKERKRKLKEEKGKYKAKLKLPSTSKLILLGAILLCLQIVIYCEYAMITTGDTSAMYVLIGIPATLVPVIWGYYSKAKAENTAGGITYDMAMWQMEHDSVNNGMGCDDGQG